MRATGGSKDTEPQDTEPQDTEPQDTEPEQARAATREALGGWLARQLASRGGRAVRLGELSEPDAGYSGRTVFAGASWTRADGERQARELVVRVQVPDQQLFVAPDALRQARTMAALAGEPGVPVPEIWFTESDPGVLGAPFYVMDRVRGRVPGDVPSWHKKGWTVELPPAQREKLYDNGLAALVALHRVDWRPRLGFLAPPGAPAPARHPGSQEPSVPPVAPGPGTALDRYLADLERWYEWCEPSRRFGPDILAAGLRHVLENRPDDPCEGVVWGDARVGNMCFADDQSVAALFDWEGATIGPAGIDLGWWLMFERYLCEAQGLRRLDGIPDREGTIARYYELGGADVPDIDYYELLAAVVMTLITSKLADVLIDSGRVTPDIAAIYPTRAVGLVTECLARLSPR
ncbi:MAG TPA: phosphotransferase family protein [Trebonia sp.]|jgi:aminoglycoside phosphotransferase (APT) family kinase protein